MIDRISGGPSPFVFSAEHGGNHMPPGWTWPEEDRWLVDTHWASDLGIHTVVQELADKLKAPATVALFSRLLIDPNRPLTSETLFRDRAEGKSVTLNQRLSNAERSRRIEELYRPYHHALDRSVAETPGANLVSLHSFTPLYEGNPRTLEVGVLFDKDHEAAEKAVAVFRAHGMAAELQQPYSGANGLMHSADVHSRAHGREAIELEFRQDLLADPEQRSKLVDATIQAIKAAWPA